MTTTEHTHTVPKMIRVYFLTRVEGKPSAEWPVERTEDMEYTEYLSLSAGDLAHTRPRFIDSDGNEIIR